MLLKKIIYNSNLIYILLIFDFIIKIPKPLKAYIGRKGKIQIFLDILLDFFLTIGLHDKNLVLFTFIIFSKNQPLKPNIKKNFIYVS